MKNADTLSVRLLGQVLEAAGARGFDQAQLANEAGLKPETISRAKKRVGMALSTLSRLASAVGLQVVLQPAGVPVTQPLPHASRPAALSSPQFGLAWSNPGAPEDALLRNALLQGRFDAILESAAQDGVAFVRKHMIGLRQEGALDDGRFVKLDRMVNSIERGFSDAQNGATAHETA